MVNIDMPELAARLAFLCAGGRRAPRRELLQKHRSASAALAAGPQAWRAAGLIEDVCIRLRRGADPEVWLRTAEWLQRPGNQVIAWHDPDYPAALRTVSSAPLLLFASGDATLLQDPAVAIVGTRSASVGGRALANQFAQRLASAGLAVVSGLAAGIDGAAHEGALEAAGSTIAVLGSGPDLCYPAQHRDLHARIAAKGLLVSEYPPGTQPLRDHFPARNRIIAGLALGTLVVEAAARSGALITAQFAVEAGREVWAIPGSVHNPQARGCHRLIRDGAQLVERAEDVLLSLAPALGRVVAQPARRPASRAIAAIPLPEDLDSDHKTVWSALGHDPIPMDTLADRTALTPARLSSILLSMELQGRVKVTHGRYLRTPG
ncbi:DNA-processing protein DprA [Solilutibacter silvestris]|uniref:DprA: DNA protecting protein DprA n=1 Tax=Solilutibacter silvestris TaxID=1645665 RepID=A0A2K1Q0F1_9GAMM|nr:DNA-processing protein DprA [Lysobacter silvestris]PNS08518.1 dprA: DNA protecting protein DprA [Lysobacter silvestris]